MQSNVLLTFLSNASFRCAVRNYARFTRRIANIQPTTGIKNPGLQNQLNVLYDEHELKELRNEDFEDLETDFMDVDKAEKLHESEIEAFKEKQKLWIVGRKYFKENKVNFLTWNDKEQIRHLHQTNPQEWTVEKLSEGFPALPNTIAVSLDFKYLEILQIPTESNTSYVPFISLFLNINHILHT